MSSGLRFTEEYGNPFPDATFMLFGSGDAAGYAASRPLEAKPDARWQYSSGTTNILSRVLRLAAGNDATYHALHEHQRNERTHTFSLWPRRLVLARFAPYPGPTIHWLAFEPS